MLGWLEVHFGRTQEETFAWRRRLACGLSVILVEARVIAGFFTVTAQVTVVSSAFTVIVVLPGLPPVMMPSSVTVATLGLLLLQVTCERVLVRIVS